MGSRVVLVVVVVVAAAILALGPEQQTCFAYHYDQDLNEGSQGQALINWPAILDNNNNKFVTNQKPSSLNVDLQNVELETVPMNNRDANVNLYQRSTCQLVQIVHLLYQNGCQPKAIASFACAGSCTSYVQTSTSKFWQHERSCSCCQQTSLQEATFTLDCPSLDPPYRKVKTYSPVDCMCRACTDLGKEKIQPQELIEALAGENGGGGVGGDTKLDA